MIPSGYKTGKVYSAVPTDGTGDLVFSRSNDTATRVASNGLIEKVRTNLNPNGNLVGLALNTNPTGYTNFNTGTFEPVTNTTSEVGTFCKFTTSATRSFLERTFTGLTIGQAYAFSYKVQAVSGGLLANQSFSFFSGVTLSSFYINGVSSPTGSDSVTTGLIYIVGVATSTSISIRIGSGVFGATTAVLEIGNFQLETGDIATDYIPTTTAAVSVGPVANVPRLDYLNSTCPKLLLEPQRTNLVTFSEQIDNAAWVKSTTTVTANAQVSPDGYTNAETMTVSTSASIVEQTMSLGAGTYTFSVYVKVISQTTAGQMRLQGLVDAANVSVNFTPTTEWQRFTATYTPTATLTSVRVRGQSFVGTLAVWGAQLETASYATSYIPTLAASVTRGADAASKTGISSLIGQTQGTLFIQADNRILGQTNRFLFQVSDATGNNFIALNYSSAQADTIRLFVLANGVVSALTFIINTAPILKLAVSYKNGVSKLFINGSLAYTQTGGSFTSNLESIYLGVNRLSTEAVADGISSFQVYKTELSNAQIQELTTL